MKYFKLSDFEYSETAINKIPKETIPNYENILKEYEDNEDAIENGLEEGAFYRTGDILKIVHK